ncbi:MAG: peptide deformylase [Solirubrobacterales bacterium]|nr:peptide deformylase [Solirubrobacterales bacterium]
MSVLPIATVGDPVLRERAQEVAPEELRSPGVQRLIDDLIETRRAAGGAGLAANQVSVTRRIAVVEVDEHTRYAYKPRVPLTVIVNPVIQPLSRERLLVNEGCLSVPDLRGDVERLVAVRVHYVDRGGNPRELDAHGLTAGTFQHEVDHLDGVLFLDRVKDPRSFSTWEQFARHHEQAFLRRIAPYAAPSAGAG